MFVGMDTDSGDLLAVYKWTFQSAKKLDSRRIKQVEESSVGTYLRQKEEDLTNVFSCRWNQSNRNLRIL